MNESAYRQHRAANYSNLKHLVSGTAKDYKHAIDNPLAPTRPMELGTIIHGVFLEGKPFESMAVVAPDDAPKRPSSKQINAKKPSAETVFAIDFWNKFNSVADGKIVLDSEEKANVEGAVAALMESDWLRDVMKDSLNEIPYFGTLDEIECKGLLDIINIATKSVPTLIVDLKCNAQDVGPEAFKRTIGQRNYDLQCSLYSELVSLHHQCARPNWVWAVVGTVPPYNLAFHESKDENYASGRAKLSTCFGKLKDATASGKWSSYPDYPVPLEMSKWSQAHLQNTLADQ